MCSFDLEFFGKRFKSKNYPFKLRLELKVKGGFLMGIVLLFSFLSVHFSWGRLVVFVYVC